MVSDYEEDFESYRTTFDMSDLVVNRTEGLTTEDLVEKIVLIAEFLAGSPFYPYQRPFAERIVEAVLEREAEELSALFSRQSGKSQVLAAIVAALMYIMPWLAAQYPEDDRFSYSDKETGITKSYVDGFWVGIFAPKKEQSGIIFKRIKTFFKRPESIQLLGELGLHFDTMNGDTISLSNGSFVKCKTASDNANIEGDTLHLGIEDEAQDISDEKSSKSIGPMMAATAGTLVKIGTANARKSHFYNTIKRNERRYREGARKCHFFSDWVTAARYNKLYAVYVRKEMLRLGERSDEFRMAYMCEFMMARGMAMNERMFSGRCVTDPAHAPYHELILLPRPGKHYVAGIDFGKVHDSTVATIIEVDWDNPRQVLEGYNVEDGAFTVEIFGKHLCTWYAMQGDDYESQFWQLKAFLKPWNIARLALDSTGVGGSLGDRFQAHYDGVDIELCVYSDQMKDQLGRQFLSDVAAGYITWPAGPEVRESKEWLSFRGEMLDLEKEYRPKSGLLSLHHPDVRGAHDDFCDSAMLAIHAACTRPYGGDVEETDNPFRVANRATSASIPA